jgi:ABC-type uncharacterized transport system involved in gliding motility auxiliary subunit
MRIRRSHLANIAYWVCVVILMGAGAWYVLNREFDVLIRIALIMAIIALMLGVLADPERVRKAITGRQARYGSNAVLFSLAFVGILVVLNFMVYANPIKLDLTEDKLYSLSPETIQILDGLEEQVKIFGFYSVNMFSSRENIRPLLDQYHLNSKGMLDYEFIDPDEDPIMAQQLNIIRDGSLVITLGETSEVIDIASEEEITAALYRVLHPQEHKLYFVVGHGERDIYGTDEFGFSELARSLESKNVQFENLNLLSEGNIPEDASALVIGVPMAQFLETEIELISEYMQDAGSLIVLFEPMPPSAEENETTLLENYLRAEWGIDPLNNIVVDMSSNQPFYGVSTYYADHPITQNMGNLYSYFPTAKSLKILNNQEPSVIRTELVLTGERSWGETDWAAIEEQGQLEFNEDDEEGGPLPLIVSAEDSVQNSRILAFGDSDFVTNLFFYQYGNRDLFLYSIDWIVGEEQLISLTPKQTTSRYVLPPTNQVLGMVFLITIVLIPGVVIVAGVSTWWQRRKRE